MYSHQQTRISIAVLKSRFDPLLEKGQYKNNYELKNNNTCNNNYQSGKHEITGEVFSKTASPFKPSDLKQGGGGHLFQRGCLLEGGH